MLFDKCLNGLWLGIKSVFTIIIYLPLFITGYMMAVYLYPTNNHSLLVPGFALLIAFIFYLLVYFIKGAMLALKFNKNFLWIPMFILSVAFTCILPIWLMYEPLSGITSTLPAGAWLNWVVLTGYATYIYSKYKFLTSRAPRMAQPFYRAGITAASALLKLNIRINLIR